MYPNSVVSTPTHPRGRVSVRETDKCKDHQFYKLKAIYTAAIPILSCGKPSETISHAHNSTQNGHTFKKLNKGFDKHSTINTR